MCKFPWHLNANLTNIMLFQKSGEKKNHFDVITISVTITWVIEADVILQQMTNRFEEIFLYRLKKKPATC